MGWDGMGQAAQGGDGPMTRLACAPGQWVRCTHDLSLSKAKAQVLSWRQRHPQPLAARSVRQQPHLASLRRIQHPRRLCRPVRGRKGGREAKQALGGQGCKLAARVLSDK